MKNFLVLALSALFLFAVGTAWLLLFPAVPRDLGGAADLDSQARRVRVAVAVGDSLDAWVLPGVRPGVIVAFHGYARNHARVWRYAEFLRRDGWTIVAPDFRSSRERNRKPTTLGHYEREDAEAVLAWIAAQPELSTQPLGLFGESLGASVALVVAADRPGVRVVVADCPFANGRLAIEDGCVCEGHVPAVPFAAITRAIGRIVTGRDPAALDVVDAVARYGDRPLFLVQAGVEDRFRIPQTRLLENAAGARTEAWRVGDSGHNQAWIRHRGEYERRVRSFYREFLREPARSRVEVR